jgi:hypothetical protein
MPDGRLEEVVRLLAPAIDLSELAPDVAARLVDRLVPVYAGVEYRVVSRMTLDTLSRRSIDRVKASRWAVIARSSFADA